MGQLDLADRLQAAMDDAGLSRRGLAVRLAGSTADKTQIERWRKAIRRMLSGQQKTIQAATAARLSEILGVPTRYWPTDRSLRPLQPIQAAEELLRLRAAGEPIPEGELEAMATVLEETATIYRRLADQLRSSSASEGSTP